MCRSTNDSCSQYGSGDGGCITCAIRAMSVDCIIRRLHHVCRSTTDSCSQYGSGDGGCITCVVRPMTAAHNTVVVMVVASRVSFDQ